MNRRMVLYMVGSVIKIEALLMILPLIVSLIYGENNTAVSFGISIAATMGIGYAMTLAVRPKNKVIYAKEGFVTVALSWLFLSISFSKCCFTIWTADCP